MFKSKLLGAVIAVSAAALLAPVTTASAAKAKKISYEEAWATCRQEVSILPGEQQQNRYARGAACMKKHGYRLKKSSLSSM